MEENKYHRKFDKNLFKDYHFYRNTAFMETDTLTESPITGLNTPQKAEVVSQTDTRFERLVQKAVRPIAVGAILLLSANLLNSQDPFIIGNAINIFERGKQFVQERFSTIPKPHMAFIRRHSHATI